MAGMRSRKSVSFAVLVSAMTAPWPFADGSVWKVRVWPETRVSVRSSACIVPRPYHRSEVACRGSLSPRRGEGRGEGRLGVTDVGGARPREHVERPTGSIAGELLERVV